MMIGYDSAFIGGTLALTSFKKEFHFDKLSKSQVNFTSANIVSCYQAGESWIDFMVIKKVAHMQQVHSLEHSSHILLATSSDARRASLSLPLSLHLVLQ